MRNMKLSSSILNSKVLCYLIVLFPLFGVGGIKNVLGNEFVQAQMLLSLGVLVYLTIQERILYITQFNIFYFFYSIEVFLVTYFKQGLSIGLLISVVSYMFLFSLMVVDVMEVLEAYCILASFFIVINFLTVIQNINADSFFIGGKNRLSIIIVPSVILIFENSIVKNGKIDWFAKLIAILGIVSVIMAKSGTGILVAVLAVVLYGAFNKLKINKKLALLSIFTVYVGIILFTKVLLNSSLWIQIASAVGKNSDLTGRTIVWNNLLTLLKSNWLLGLGKEAPNVFKNIWNLRTTAMEAHNYVLELFLDGGLIGFVLYMIAFFSAVKELDMKEEIDKLVFIGIVLVLINGLTESVVNIFPSVVLLAFSNSINNLKVMGTRYE